MRTTPLLKRVSLFSKTNLLNRQNNKKIADNCPDAFTSLHHIPEFSIKNQPKSPMSNRTKDIVQGKRFNDYSTL